MVGALVVLRWVVHLVVSWLGCGGISSFSTRLGVHGIRIIGPVATKLRHIFPRSSLWQLSQRISCVNIERCARIRVHKSMNKFCSFCVFCGTTITIQAQLCRFYFEKTILLNSIRAQ